MSAVLVVLWLYTKYLGPMLLILHIILGNLTLVAGIVSGLVV